MRAVRVAAIATVSIVVLIAIGIVVWFVIRTNDDADDATSPTISISQGVVRGTSMTTINGRAIYGFMGIPYAEPPTGDLRFAAPVAKGNWSGILDATDNAEECNQMGGGVQSGDEDCLFINVYTPQLPDGNDTSLLPVLVYIHGGAFKLGSGASVPFGPDYLLDKDIVLVAMNYRLNVFGFLSTGDETAPGNFALKDQLLALQWTRDNIAYFGGDPDKITLGGISAGSDAVHLLTLSDQAKGLFRGYITQSGLATSTWGQQPRESYANFAYQLGATFDCANDTSALLVACLRGINASQILTAALNMTAWNGQLPTIVWSPTVEPDIDGALLPDDVPTMLATGKTANVPWLNGVTANEGFINTGYFLTHSDEFQEFLADFDDLLQYLLVWYGHDIDIAGLSTAVKQWYFNNDFTANSTVLFTNITDIVTYDSWKYPVKVALDYHLSNTTSPAYLYSFNYRGTYSQTYALTGSNENYGAVHGDDTMYMFPQKEEFFPQANWEFTEDELAIKDVMVQMISSFVIDGAPSIEGLDETWEPYSLAEDNYLQIGNNTSIELAIAHTFTDAQMQFWIELASSN